MNHILILILASSLVFSGLVIAEEASFTLEENQENDDLNRFLLDQFKKREASKAAIKQESYEDLLRKYPDVVPRPAPGTFTGRSGVGSEFVYDSNFANTIFFDRRSSYLSNVQKDKLKVVIQNMQDEPSFNLIIVGHSSFNSHIDDAEKRLHYNLWISGRRAVKVLDFMVKNGIDQNRLELYAKDSQEPLNGETNNREISLNQRVELRLTSEPIAAGSNQLKKEQPKKSPRQNTQTNTATN